MKNLLGFLLVLLVHPSLAMDEVAVDEVAMDGVGNVAAPISRTESGTTPKRQPITTHCVCLEVTINSSVQVRSR